MSYDKNYYVHKVVAQYLSCALYIMVIMEGHPGSIPASQIVTEYNEKHDFVSLSLSLSPSFLSR